MSQKRFHSLAEGQYILYKVDVTQFHGKSLKVRLFPDGMDSHGKSGVVHLFPNLKKKAARQVMGSHGQPCRGQRGGGAGVIIDEI
jgi:uncharacterized protein YjhX (UPF0386 family)